MTDYSEEAMRERFHTLGAEKAEIEAKIAPIRARRESLAQQMQALDREIRPLEAKIKEATLPRLYDIDMERSRLARALKGKTGEVPK